MKLVSVTADNPLPFAERRRVGRELRQRVPRRAHAVWSPAPSRADPVRTIIDRERLLIRKLLPIRYSRMRPNAFAFLRGAAAIMAADLAMTPASGLLVQACGDCHLSNFGTFSSPEGTPVFDINDFDETLRAPFEWDLKRLATSFVVAARSRRVSDRRAGALATAACRAYRERLAVFARLDPLRVWRARIDVAEALTTIGNATLREREAKRLRAVAEAHRGGYSRLIERRGKDWRIKLALPYTFPLTDPHDETLDLAARAAFRSYAGTLEEEQQLLLERYRLTDIAFKVAGVGSVGTFCAIGLFTTADGDTLLLQLKEAQRSVLAAFAGPSRFVNQGKRVVVGQRIMQATVDPFLGWTDDHGDDRPCYVRQLKDSRMAMIGEAFADSALEAHAVLCGQALARAHARSQDAACLSGYIGSSDALDAAITEFAMAYADQTESDYRLFVDALEFRALAGRSLVTTQELLAPDLLGAAEALLSACRARGALLATAESCTGGLIAAALTAIAGSSDVVDRGFVTYSNQAKTEMLDVQPALIDTVGAVSGEVAAAMAAGAIRHSRATIAVSVTGVAGPGGGTETKPVGLVYFGLARRDGATTTERHVFEGDRTAVRLATVAHALGLIRTAL